MVFDAAVEDYKRWEVRSSRDVASQVFSSRSVEATFTDNQIDDR